MEEIRNAYKIVVGKHDNFVDQVVDGNIILKYVLKRKDVRV
jgi:hypothetical protein